MSKKLLIAAADAAAANEKHVQIPLRDWIEGVDEENNNLSLAAAKVEDIQSGSSNENDNMSKESIIRKVTVAYGIVELLIRCPANNVLLDDDAKIGIDNFAVCVVDRSSSQQRKHQPSSSSWDDIRGVRMLSSGLSLSIEEPSYLSCLFEEGGENNIHQMGRYLEVELDAANTLVGITKADCRDSTEGEGKEISNLRCHYLLAQILQQLFTNDEGKAFSDDKQGEPAPKKAKKVMMEVPASICRVVQNLFESASESCGDAYKTLEEVGKDLHLLLFDPDRFLFDREAQNTDKMQLFFKKEKLYGRDKEETLITDTFCRVTRGKSEAFFIGGFSGSGKSMLVDTLRVNVKNVGGYVIKHKFDAMSQDRPLSGIISALNQLCLMIKKRLSPQRLTALSEKLKDDFGDDIDVLARMLPNICLLSPECSTPSVGAEDEDTSDKMNPRSVSFTLLRFVRLVSSPRNPIMLFLDDLQWADDTAFDTIHTFLSDTMGSCILFVGTYRDNEVEAGHAIFDLMDNLDASNVPTNKVTLTGLDEENVNEMISDALCLYPRICKSLSDIVFHKTKGNPYFVLEFMQSLHSRGLLQYDSGQKRWVWNEDTIRAEEITNNVLHLLSSKMNQLPNDMQLLLKVMACFGISSKESVIGYLAESPEYSELCSGLEGAISDGFVEMYEGYIKFVHDKVREAAYNLIPDKDKKQLHYNLGKTLYAICKGKDVGNTIFLIASQINHGKEFIETDDALRIPVAKLNIKAGKMALDGCDHKLAYHYFAASLSLLPDDSWESNYDLSLRLNFLMARAANSSCRYDEAEVTLQTICKRALCLQDKLPSYYLLVMIFLARGNPNKAFDTCSSILTQLGETVPDAVTVKTVGGMIPETLSMYSKVYGDDWLGKKMEDTNICSITKFYSAIATAAFFCKPAHMVAYFVCKMVQISLQNGICEHTPLAFMQLSSIAFNRTIDVRFTNAAFIQGIAKSALVLSEKFGSSDDKPHVCINYFLGAGHLEPYHLNASQLRKGFSAGLSSGGANTAFFCAAHAILFSIISAEKDLTSLLKEIDYYLLLLETYKNELTKKFILCYRETVATLIDKGETTGIEAKLSLRDVEACDIGEGNKLQEAFYFQQMLRNHWLGYTERCRHYAEKYSIIVNKGHIFNFNNKFYYGLNLLEMIKKKENYSKSIEVDEIIASMKVAASHTETNFRNKLELLEAEKYGMSAHHESVVVFQAYDKSIISAQKAGFLHEQGLACEKAGLYCKRMKDNERSLSYFNQALDCYEKWGSSVKVECIRKELGKLHL